TPLSSPPQHNDACTANPTVTFADEALPLTSNQLSNTKRTSTATDAPNPTPPSTHPITVLDSAAPTVASCPTDATIECPATPVFGTPQFSDACASVTVTFADEPLAVSGNQVSMTKRTWTATDAHNNSTTCSQTITVLDSTAPTVASCPTDATIECPATPVFGTPEFSDRCVTNLTVTFADEALALSGNEVSKTKRTWTATDAHNNSTTCSQTIPVLDSSPSTALSRSTDATIECPPTTVFGTPEF